MVVQEVPTARAAEVPRVVVVGLDGLDYDFIRNRSNLDFMPNLNGLLSDRNTRVLQSKPTKPILSPIIWTSMVTGASPTRHDILDFFSYQQGQPLPISTMDRKMPAIWNILSSKGIRTLCLGPFISYPAEIVDGVYISDEAFTQRVRDRTSIHPVRRVDDIGTAIGELMERQHGWQSAVDSIADQQLRFNLDRVFYITRAKLELFVRLLDEDQFRFAMVYIEGTDEIGHFLSHLWPTPIDDDAAELSKSVASTVPAYFALVDRYLGEILSYCRTNDAQLIIVSDHGFKWQKNRPSSVPHASEHAASWHSERGVFLIHRAGLSLTQLRSSEATVYDLFPTLIDIYRLRHARYEMGRSLFGRTQRETEDYSSTVTTQTVLAKRSDDREWVERLEALGYVRRGSNLNQSRYYNNLGITHDEEGNTAAAIQAFGAAIEIAPSNPHPPYNLSMVYFDTRDWDRFIEEFLNSIELGLPNGELAVVKVVESLAGLGQVGVLERLLAHPLEIDPQLLNPHFFRLARTYYDSDPATTLKWLDRIQSPTPDCRVLFLKATCHLRLGQEEQALVPLREAGCTKELDMLTR
jgi:predicted AlkP superfamily phosphohydrolase/phosphomutase